MPYDSVFKPDLFAGETIIITGGGSGIGRCIAHELAALGANVVITGRSQEKLDSVTAEITEDGGKVDSFAFDIRAEDDVAENIGRILAKHGPVSGLVNNAGGQFAALLEDISQKGWETVIRTNLTGGFLMSRELVKQSMRDTGGSIVNITADYWRSMPKMGHSGAARAGMENFSKTAAIEWAHYGIRVNTVAPGYISSSGLHTYSEDHKKLIRWRRDRVPARRNGTEAEVSGAVVFLLTPAASFISGESIRVDGAAPNQTLTYHVPDHDGSPVYDGFHRSIAVDFLDPDFKFDGED
jgi:citronellol/citronellal dehydrogenase